MTKLLTLVLCLGCICFIAEPTQSKDLQKSGDATVFTWDTVPLNTAVVAGKQTSFICIISPAATLTWYFREIGSETQVIIIGDCVVNPAFAGIYGVVNVLPGRCDLVVLNATTALAGLYGCQGGFDTAVTAHLSVLESDPVCTSDVVEPVLVAERVTYTCEVSYTSNISPMLMSWTDSQGQPMASVTNNTVPGHSRSSISVTTTWPTVPTYTCTTHFSPPINTSATATNTPTYSHFWTSPVYAIVTPGVGYTRWGRTTCGNGSELIYTGVVAGTNYNEVGNGGNFLCAHESPQIGPGNVAGTTTSSGRLYGAEFMIAAPYGQNLPFSYENLGNQTTLNRQDAVCAQCYRPKRSYNMMIPGRHDCGVGNNEWVLEYKGYLVSSLSTYYSSEYICVDEAPEVRTGGQASQTATSFLYPVQAYCGSLPCPGYEAGMEVTCAVCSR